MPAESATSTPTVESLAEEAPAKPPLTAGEKVGFALGGAQQNFGYLPKQIISPVYNILLGVNPALLGTALLINRLTEAMIEPWIGYQVDRRFRTGRKCKPLIWIGGIGSAVLLPVMFLAGPNWGEYSKLVYLLLASTFFVCAFSTFTVCLNAMLVARTGDGPDRNRLAAWFTAGMILAGTLGNWTLPLILKMVKPGRGQFPLLLCTGGIAALMLLCTLILNLRSREQARPIKPGDGQGRKSSSYGDMLRVLRVKPFRLLVIVSCIAVFGGNIIGQFGIYVKGYYMFGGDVTRGAFWTAIAGTAYQASALACMPLFEYLAERLGKRNTILAAISCGIVGETVKWFVHQPGVPPICLPFVAAFMAPYGAMSMLVLSLLGDACDWDEAHNGVRREGTMVGVMSVFNKAGMIITPVISGLLLVWSGFDASLGGNQPHKVLISMRVFYSAVPFACACTAFVLMMMLPTPPRRHA